MKSQFMKFSDSQARWQKALYVYLLFSMLLVFSQSFVRLLLYILFSTEEIRSTSTPYLLGSFWLGARFDFAVANYILILPCLLGILVALFRWKLAWKFYHWLERSYLYVFLALVSLLSIFNLTFYSYFKDHFNLLVFGLIEDDTVALVKTIWRNEPVLWELVGIFTLLYALWKSLSFFERLAEKGVRRWRAPKFLVLGFQVLFIFWVGLGARGSLNFDMHPLNRIHTEVSPIYFLNQLAFSPIYALKDAFVLKANISANDYDIAEKMGYAGKMEQAVKDYSLGASAAKDPKHFAMHTSSKKKAMAPHVVVVAMESMGSFWLKFHNKDTYPILGAMEKHVKEDAMNWQILPSGSGTYSSVTHWLLNMAELPGVAAAEKYIDREFLTSAVRPFKQAGYQTHYVYGGGLGWRNLSGFLMRLGFDELHGETRIQQSFSKDIETHDWGIFDEDLFSYVESLLKEAKTPQFIFVLSTTNHPPFSLPSTYKKPEFSYPKDLSSRLTQQSDTLLPRLQAYSYAMNSLGIFMDRIKSSDLRERVVVAASGDHSFYESVSFTPQKYFEWKAVPFYLYSSIPINKEVFAEAFGAHQDIFPTLYELCLSETKYLSMGRSLLSTQDGASVTGGALIDRDYAWVYGKLYQRDAVGMDRSYGPSGDAKDKERYEHRLKAYYSLASELLKQGEEEKPQQ